MRMRQPLLRKDAAAERTRWSTLAIALALVSGCGSSVDPGAPTEMWWGSRTQAVASPAYAFVWADQPSLALGTTYVPANAHTWSTGGPISVTHVALGIYEVRFAGLGEDSNGGILHAVAANSNVERCKIDSWWTVLPDLYARIMCHDPSVGPLDTPFVATYYRHHMPPPINAAYVANLGLNPAVPSPFWQWSSAGPVNVTRSAPGDYNVTLNGMNLTNGNVQVTAMGGTNEHCKVGSLGLAGVDTVVRVLCYNNGGLPADSKFTFSFFRNTDPIIAPGGHFFANMPGTASYVPAWSWNSSAAGNLARRVSAGHYYADYGILTNTGSTTLVTAFGVNPRYCKLDMSPTWNGSGTRNTVRCFTPTGVIADTAYMHVYMKHP